jgi:hypothetical protein
MCISGVLPRRLAEHDALDLLVSIEEKPVSELRELGVEDGTRKRWSASRENIERFIAVANASKLPPPVKSGPSEQQLCECKVHITARRQNTSGAPDRLEVVFKNDGPIAIPVAGAKIEWKYSPPRKAPVSKGVASVQEIGGSISLSCESRERSIDPSRELVFYLPEDMTSGLVTMLADDVTDNDISVVVSTTRGMGWSENQEGIPQEVKAAAQSVVSLWDSE